MKKPWLLQTPNERQAAADPDQPGLLATGLYSAMQHNAELRDEVKRLEKNLNSAVELIGILNAKIALLSTLQKHGTGQNPTTNANYDVPSDGN